MNRILVVLPNWFGETLFVTPFLRVLRQQRPDAYLATLGWPTCRAILLHNPHVDEFLDYDERGAHRGLAGSWRLIQALRAHRVDAAFILRRSFSRTLLLALAGIPTRVGFANAKSGWLLTHRVRPSPMPRHPAMGGDAVVRVGGMSPHAGRGVPGATGMPVGLHKAFSYLPLLEAVGLSVVRHTYEYTVSPEERRAVQELWPSTRDENGRPLIVLHPGANWSHKRWAADRFAALGDRLISAHQARVLITGGPDDVALAESIQRAMRQPAVLVAGQTTVRQLGALLEQVQLVVSNDTGILHLAAALHRPLVALYGPTSPTLTGPLGDPQRTAVLHHADCCPRIPCYQPHHPAHPGMDAISVDEAYAAACQMLNAECRIRNDQ